MVWIVVLEKTLESPLDCKEIPPVHSKGDQPWMFFGRNDAKAKTPVLWPSHMKSWVIGKDPGAGRDWGQEEKGMTENEMAGWHHWLGGCAFEWTLGGGDGQGVLACCDSWGCKESDTTEWLNENHYKGLCKHFIFPVVGVHCSTLNWVHLFYSSILFWRRVWQPTPVFLPGESHGQRNLEGYCPWGHTESGTIERLSTQAILFNLSFYVEQKKKKKKTLAL